MRYSALGSLPCLLYGVRRFLPSPFPVVAGIADPGHPPIIAQPRKRSGLGTLITSATQSPARTKGAALIGARPSRVCGQQASRLLLLVFPRWAGETPTRHTAETAVLRVPRPQSLRGSVAGGPHPTSRNPLDNNPAPKTFGAGLSDPVSNPESSRDGRHLTFLAAKTSPPLASATLNRCISALR